MDLRVKVALSSWMELTVHQHITENMDLRVKAAVSSWMELTVHQHIKENMDLRVKVALPWELTFKWKEAACRAEWN